MGPCTTAPGDSEVSRGKVTTNEEKLHVGPEKLVLNKRGSGKEINGSFRQSKEGSFRQSVRGQRPPTLDFSTTLEMPEMDFNSPRPASRSSPRTERQIAKAKARLPAAIQAIAVKNQAFCLKQITTLDDLLFLYEQTPSAPKISIEKWREEGIFNTSQEGIKINFKNWYGAQEKSGKNASYEGQMTEKGANMQGLGRLIYHTTGNIYEGQFQKSKPHGFGRLIYGEQDKETFIGQFVNGDPSDAKSSPEKVQKNDNMEVEGQSDVMKKVMQQLIKEKEDKVIDSDKKKDVIPFEVEAIVNTPEKEKEVKQEELPEEATPIEKETQEDELPEEKQKEDELPEEASPNEKRYTKNGTLAEVKVSQDSEDSEDSKDQVDPLFDNHLEPRTPLGHSQTSIFKNDEIQGRSLSVNEFGQNALARSETSIIREKRKSSILGIGELQAKMIDKWRQESAEVCLNQARSEFYELRQRKWRYVIFNAEGKDKIVVGACGDREKTFDDLITEKEATKSDPCWMAFDMEYSFKDHGVETQKSKIVLIIYAPDECAEPAKKARVLFQKAKFLKELTHDTGLKASMSEYTARKWKDLSQFLILKSINK